MDDVVFVTADSVRYDHVDAMGFVDSLDPVVGVTAGHYTRPSLAALHSGSLAGAVRSRVTEPSLASVLSEAGYTCIGLAPTAQADPAFGFDSGFDQYDNFTEGGGNPVRNRRSRLREYLGSFEVVRRIYYRLFPMEAILSGVPPDGEVIDEAIDRFNAADPPRFLWIHLMGTHRPYGRGETALPTDLDRKAGASGTRLGRELTGEERERVVSTYRSALGRADDEIRRLVESLDADPAFVFTSDHGDELGEEGYYYHQGYRRRVPDTIIRVPLAFDGVGVDARRGSLLDVAPTLASAAGADVPGAWHGNDLRETETEETVTVAPWHDTATVAWQDFERKVIAADADVSFQGDERFDVERTAVGGDVEDRLRELGYMDAG